MGIKNEIRMETWLNQVVRTILLILTVLCIGTAIMGGCGRFQGGWNSFAVIAGLLVVIVLLMLASNKTKQYFRVWLVIIFFVALLARLILLQLWPIEPISDFKDTYRVAEGLANVAPSAIPETMQQDFGYYYSSWSVHIVFIVLEMVLIKIFGNSYYPIQVVFNIFGALSCIMAALIAKSLYGRRAGILAGMVMALLPLNLLFGGVLTNQHIATYLFLTGIYFLIGKPCHRRGLNIVFAAVAVCLSQLVRPEMLVFVVAVVCYLLYAEVICKRGKADLWKGLKCFGLYGAAFLGVYFLLLHSVDYILLENGLIGNSITDSNVPYKIATGLNQESMGMWNEQDAAKIDDEEALKALIVERVKDAPKVIELMGNKLMYQFGTYNYSWCVIGEEGEFVKKWYNPLTTDLMLVILLLGLIEVVFAVFVRDRREALLYITLIGYFVVFAVIEVQNRYNYTFIPIFIIMASGGVVRITDTLRTVIRIRKRV